MSTAADLTTIDLSRTIRQGFPFHATRGSINRFRALLTLYHAPYAAEFLPSVSARRHGEVLDLETAPDRSTGMIVSDTPVGRLTLDDHLVHPQSDCTGYSSPIRAGSSTNAIPAWLRPDSTPGRRQR